MSLVQCPQTTPRSFWKPFDASGSGRTRGYDMSVNIRGTADPVTEAIAAALGPYVAAHPTAEAEVYRYSPVSVRARIIDPDFRGKSRSERHKTVWPLLDPLNEDVLGDLTMLRLLAPAERDTSVA